jgi:alanyl-tRNA synthetase
MESLAPDNPEVTEFEATVESVDGGAVVLSETYFYPEGGGQPADRGSIAGVDVVDVQQGDGRVVHELAADPPADTGSVVEAAVDADFRTYCRRAHTASHVLYGAARRRCADLGYAGFDIGEETVRVDLTTTTEIDDGMLVALERLANEAVWDSRSVTWERLPREEALAREDVAFNTKTEAGITGDTVRVVTVADWDVAACGGTHVSNTGEIGPITLLSRSNPGEGETRLEFAVGPTAIEHRATVHEQARDAARRLDAPVTDLAGPLDALVAERDRLERTVESLRDQVVEARLSELREQVRERDGREWLVGDVPSMDANDLADLAGSLVGTAADVVVLVGPDAEYLAVGSESDLSATDLAGRATDAFGGGGGGSDRLAQAGGLDATVEDVLALYE